MTQKNLSQRHHDVIMTSFSTWRHAWIPENQENRIFALDFLKIVARCRLTPHFFCFLKLFQKKYHCHCNIWPRTLENLEISILQILPILQTFSEKWAGFSQISVTMDQNCQKMCKTKFWSLNRLHGPSARAHFAEFTTDRRGVIFTPPQPK